jgi:hypothetical protein
VVRFTNEVKVDDVREPTVLLFDDETNGASEMVRIAAVDHTFSAVTADDESLNRGNKPARPSKIHDLTVH